MREIGIENCKSGRIAFRIFLKISCNKRYIILWCILIFEILTVNWFDCIESYLREYWKESFFEGEEGKYDTFLSESISMLLANGLD